MNIRQTIADGLRFSGIGGVGNGGSGGLTGWQDIFGFGRTLPGTNYDYRKEAGLLWENSVVLALIKWQTRTYPEARQIVERLDAEGKPVQVNEHQLLDVLERPNEYYDKSVLDAGIILSLAVDGNAYCVKLLAGAGNTVGLLYIPHFMMRPVWPKDGSEFISGYVYTVDGKNYYFSKERIVHLRDGIDPLWMGRKGLSALSAILREICSDNEAATFAAALLHNMGIPGVVISPKQMGAAGLTTSQIEEFKERWKKTLTGDGRGEPFINGIPIDITMPGFSPEQLVLDKVRSIPLGRICGAMGLDPMIIGLPSENKTYSNYESAKSAAYEANLIPLQRIIDSQMTMQLVRDVLGIRPGEFLARDYSKVRVLQPDQDKLAKRVVDLYFRGVIMRSTALRMIGEPFTAEDNVYYTDLIAPTGSGDDTSDGSDTQKVRRILGAKWRQERVAA